MANLVNKRDYQVRVNEATLATQMTARIFNACIINGFFGEWWDDDVVVWMSDSGEYPRARRTIPPQATAPSAEQKRDLASRGSESQCDPPSNGTPVAADCHRVIDAFSRTYPPIRWQ